MAAFTVRSCSHAGSWYSHKASTLEEQLTSWLEQADSVQGAEHSVGVIAPHAGYSYSGPTAAFAYKALTRERASKVKRVFILGPSHHVYLEGCAFSVASVYDTPLGKLEVDSSAYEEVMSTPGGKGLFEPMSKSTDEDEHSIEMHIPYVAHMMKQNPNNSINERGVMEGFKIVPILVGNLNSDRERQVGELLAPYLSDEANFFVISSDFCHWGARFRYQHYNQEDGPIFKSVEKLDRQGMGLIESQNVQGFTAYLKATRNTICGRHPIGVFMNALQASPRSFDVKFVRYAQSSACHKMSDSSVSYASAIIFSK